MDQLNLPIEDLEKDLRLSHSSASLLLGCESRYWHHKVGSTPKDDDYVDNQEHFAIGKAFHYVLEFTLHKHPSECGLKMSQLLEKCVTDKDILLPEEHKSLVQAMALTYLREFKERNYETIAAEFHIKDKHVIGFIDALTVDRNTGAWYILDLKTSRSITRGLNARLPRNRQLNLYSHYAPQFAEDFDLDLNKFGGCIYSVTTKSQARRKVKETEVEFVQRLMKVIRTQFFIIPKEKMDPEAIHKQHMELHERSTQLRGGEVPKQNYEYCFQYFSPCPWFSKCHPGTFTELEGEV